MRFADWKEARAYAERTSNDTGNDMAIRKVKEFGVIGYNVTFASKNDSDYTVAEIIVPVWRDTLQHGHVPSRRDIVR